MPTTRAKVIAQLHKTVRLIEEALRAAPHFGDMNWHDLTRALEGYRAELWYEQARKRESQTQATSR
jgi:hypothetical protein